MQNPGLWSITDIHCGRTQSARCNPHRTATQQIGTLCSHVIFSSHSKYPLNEQARATYLALWHLVRTIEPGLRVHLQRQIGSLKSDVRGERSHSWTAMLWVHRKCACQSCTNVTLAQMSPDTKWTNTPPDLIVVVPEQLETASSDLSSMSLGWYTPLHTSGILVHFRAGLLICIVKSVLIC